MTYDWNRYWCAREGAYELTPDGFLRPPYKRYPNAHVKSFAEIADIAVLVLLGEPGIGKTFAIKNESTAIRAAVADRAAEQILWPDLQEIESSERFAEAVIKTAEFQSWIQGKSILHLYLDALDECMLRVRTLGRLLTNSIKDGPVEALRLRLTCRTAEWSNELEADLRHLFGDSKVKAFELLPLTRRDVEVAVTTNEIESSDFFDYVERTGASSLASRPVPLDFLIRCFRRGDLPKTQVELYERGCLSLCEESEHRTETGLARALSAGQRLAVAKRLAAYSVFSARSIFLFGRDDTDVPTDALQVSELAGGHETDGISTFGITETAVRDALDTGLFTSRGAKLLGWAHHTYQEYLAARHVSDSPLSLHQLLTLIVHPDDPDRKLTPQLHGVAAWLSILRPEIFRYVAEHEPELLLLSDAVVDCAENRSLLVVELLSRMRKRQLPHIDVRSYTKFRKLAHPALAEQLRPVLMNSAEPEKLREFAADIAEYTGCSELLPELTLLTLDVAQPVDVRIDAATAVIRLGSDQDRAALKPLLAGPAKTRQERWLIRQALKAAWPVALSADELFQHLGSSGRRLGSIGDDFMLAEHIAETLREEHLLAAVNWVLRRIRRLPETSTITLRNALERLEDRILIRAFRSNEAGVLAVAAEVAVEKIVRYDAFVTRDDDDDGESTEALFSDSGRRRKFATFLLPALAARPKAPSPWMIFEKTQYLRSEDVEWLSQRQMSVPLSAQSQALEANVLLSVADLETPSSFDIVWRAADHNPALRRRLTEICAAVDLHSSYATEAKAAFVESKRRADRQQRRTSNRKKRPSFTTKRLSEWLEIIKDQPCRFWQLLEDMGRVPDNDYANSMTLDIRTFPGWSIADEAMRLEILRGADRFIRECDPHAETWFGTREFSLSAMGGVRALTLLKDEAPATYASFDGWIWEKWLPALLGIPNNDPTVPLLPDAYRQVPDAVVTRLQQLVCAKETYVVHRLSGMLDSRVAGALVEVARHDRLDDKTLLDLVRPLLEDADAMHFAEELVKESYKAEERDRAAAVASALLVDVPNDSWATIWPLIEEDLTFGRTVIEAAVSLDHMEAKPVWALPEDAVADLYLWLCQAYPPELDPEHEGVYTPTTRDHVSFWRSRCLESLKRRGTRAGCDALRRLAARLPAQAYLFALIAEAESVRRQKSWQPTTLPVFRSLLLDSARRQVRSETELADVVVESLRRLELKLHGETPAVFDLWNTSPHKPKTENEISNYLARHLRDDLAERHVIIAREVEIRPSTSPGSGERTDIHLDVAVDAGVRTETFSLIIETKGCWNRKLGSDIADQLARRYLRENQTRTGVYVVAWFHSAKWDTHDSRKSLCRSDQAGLLDALAREADALKGEGFDIRPVVLNCSLR